MNNQPWVTLIVEPFIDFVITAGSAYTAITTGANIPSWPAISVCLVGGLIAAARCAQKLLTPTPKATE
jgi:hypothetical protein